MPHGGLGVRDERDHARAHPHGAFGVLCVSVDHRTHRVPKRWVRLQLPQEGNAVNDIRDEIREAYVRPVGIFGGYGSEHRSKLFDQWERGIRAEAIRVAVHDAPKKYYQRDSYGHQGCAAPTDWLESRADQIENGTSYV